MRDEPGRESSHRTAKPDGVVTRGTTHPNRLRRLDRWIGHAFGRELRANDRSVAVDLGYGRSPITTREWSDRLRAQFGPRVDVVGIEIDEQRVRDAQRYTDEGLCFRHGGFEIPLAENESPRLVRALNVLRQYDESEVEGVWTKVVRRLTRDGAFVEGTCDELGRRCVWVTLHHADLRTNGHAQPRTITFAADTATLSRPSELAERLPKALIHRNVEGEAIHEFFREWDRAWARSAPTAPFGPRQRWSEAARILRSAGQPVLDGPTRWRRGELTVAWTAVSPNQAPGNLARAIR